MSVVFGPDAFTVGTDTDLDAYGGPDWAMNMGVSGDIIVQASTDDVRQTSENSDALARLIVSGMPTTDYTVGGTVAPSPSWDASTNFAVRVNASGTGYGYNTYYYIGNSIQLYRIDAGSFTLLNSVGCTHADSSSGVFQVSGTGATVSLHATFSDATNDYDDTSGSRITSGLPGIHSYNQSGHPLTSSIDDYYVDDPNAGATKIRDMIGNDFIPSPR